MPAPINIEHRLGDIFNTLRSCFPNDPLVKMLEDLVKKYRKEFTLGVEKEVKTRETKASKK